MMKIVLSFMLVAFLVMSCENESPAETPVCNPGLIESYINFHDLVNSLPGHVVTGLVKDPTAEGALGRNRDGYFHVRFQMDIGFLANYASCFKSDAALEKFILAAEYSYNHQKPEGDFELVIPEHLQYLSQPTAGDLSSGISFFMSALGSSLVLLEQSSWFHSRSADQLTQRLMDLKSKFQLSLDYLKTQKQVLLDYDRDAPNRLLFDALAFYSMGTYLNDATAKAIGIEFMELALTKQDDKGYLIEGGGFDSSYNGVSLRLGLSLLGMLKGDELIYPELQKAMSCCAQWQVSRVLSSGEISTEGNTRVYPGGEQFLGEEKGVSWTDTLLSLYFVHAFNGQTTYLELAGKLENYYK